VVCRAQQSSPNFLAGKYFRRTLYGDTPEGVVSATSASTAAFTVDGIRNFYSQHYSPQNTIVIVAGDITPAIAFTAVSEVLKSWKGTDLHVTIPPVTTETMPRSVTLVDRLIPCRRTLFLAVSPSTGAIPTMCPSQLPITSSGHPRPDGSSCACAREKLHL
jgi:predicted Zn-dependent peptidase